MWILSAVLGVWLLLLIWLIAKWVCCRRASESAEGTVTAVHRRQLSGGMTQYRTAFTFEAAGKAYSGALQYADTEQRLSAGERVSVRYHAKHPRCCYAVRDMSAYGRGLVPVLLTVVCIVPVLFLFDGMARFAVGFQALAERRMIRMTVWVVFYALVLGLCVAALRVWRVMQKRGRPVNGEVLRKAAIGRQTVLIVGYEADGLQLITNLRAEKGRSDAPGDRIELFADRKFPQNVWTGKHMTFGMKLAYAAVFGIGVLMLILDAVSRFREIMQM